MMLMFVLSTQIVWGHYSVTGHEDKVTFFLLIVLEWVGVGAEGRGSVFNLFSLSPLLPDTVYLSTSLSLT